jgi:hypothetical protein
MSEPAHTELAAWDALNNEALAESERRSGATVVSGMVRGPAHVRQESEERE